MYLLPASAHNSETNNLYYLGESGLQTHIEIKNVQNFLTKLLNGESSMSTNEFKDYENAMGIVSNNTIVTNNEQEICATMDEAIYNGLRILAKNQKYSDLVLPLLALYDSTVMFDQKKVENSYNVIMNRPEVHEAIEDLFNKLLPKIASKHTGGMSRYKELGLWGVNHSRYKGSINTRNVLLRLGEKIKATLGQNGDDIIYSPGYTKVSLRRLYLRALSVEQEKELLDAINKKISSSFKGVFAVEDLTDKKIQFSLKRDEDNIFQCHINNIASYFDQPTFTGHRTDEDKDAILAVIDELAQK